MKPLSLILGVLAGVAGAGVWAAIAYFANLQIGYVAWGIGLLVGLAVARGGSGGITAGVVAASITLVSILAGKFAVVEIALQQNFGAGMITDERVISIISDEIIEARVDAGQPVNWPAGSNLQEAWEEKDYPRDVWMEARDYWNRQSPEEQAQMRSDLEQAFAEDMNTVRQAGFLGSFQPMDLLFFGLGIVTAFSVAKNAEESDDEDRPLGGHSYAIDDDAGGDPPGMAPASRPDGSDER